MKYIFEVTVKPGQRAADYVELWKAESKIIQQEPGAQGTRLHKCIGQEDKLLAIATWQTKALRDAAMRKLSSSAEIQAIRRQHEALVSFKLIGEFEEPEWEVLPPELA